MDSAKTRRLELTTFGEESGRALVSYFAIRVVIRSGQKQAGACPGEPVRWPQSFRTAAQVEHKRLSEWSTEKSARYVASTSHLRGPQVHSVRLGASRPQS